MQQQPICFIGAGNMAQAIIAGLVDSGYPADAITATATRMSSLEPLSSQYGINITTDNNAAVRAAKVVVLAVKPQIMKGVCADIADDVQAHQPLVMSIAAGLTCDTLASWLGGYDAIVRVMPNTPSLVGIGASGLYAAKQVNDAQKAMATTLMDAVGITEWVEKESLLSAVTAVAGSAPAYFFYMMEALEKAGVSQGLTPETARRLVVQTALGAATMCAKSDDAPETLKKRVMSPKGTTERAIQHLEQGGLEVLMQGAAQACFDRAEAMGRELDT